VAGIFARWFAAVVMTAAMAAAAAGAETPAAPPVDPFGALVKLTASMAVVTGLIVASAYGAKRLLSRSRLAGGQNKVLAVRQVLTVGTRRQVFVLECAGRLLVVGASGDSMRLLATLPDSAGSEADAAAFGAMLSEANEDAEGGGNA